MKKPHFDTPPVGPPPPPGPSDHPMCECKHVLPKHKHFGPCSECECKEFKLLKRARTIEATILDPKQPWTPTPTKRGWLVTRFRRWIGLTSDVEKGELFEKLVIANFIHQAKLAEGLRRDVDAANDTQNPVNVLVAELQQRLTFYEHHNDSLMPTYRKYLREQDRLRKIAEKQAADQAQKAAKKELHDHAPPGELIDCRECGGGGSIEENRKGAIAVIICPTCQGSGVELNPDFQLPTEESNGSDSQEGGTEAPGSHHLQLET